MMDRNCSTYFFPDVNYGPDHDNWFSVDYVWAMGTCQVMWSTWSYQQDYTSAVSSRKTSFYCQEEKKTKFFFCACVRACVCVCVFCAMHFEEKISGMSQSWDFGLNEFRPLLFLIPCIHNTSFTFFLFFFLRCVCGGGGGHLNWMTQCYSASKLVKPRTLYGRSAAAMW